FSKPSSHASANKENSKANPPPKRSDTLKTNKTTVFKCYFCDRAGHMKRECHKYKRWVEKKGNKGLRKPRKPSRDQDHLFVGNGKKVPVQAIGSVRLQLVSGFPLILKDVAFVPSMRRNLISVSRLTKELFSFVFSEVGFDLVFNKNSVGNGSLI
ncbi:unnamed protein product, partial [Prunus brigantina]